LSAAAAAVSAVTAAEAAEAEAKVRDGISDGGFFLVLFRGQLSNEVEDRQRQKEERNVEREGEREKKHRRITREAV